MSFDPLWLVAAFGGGIFGAAFGAVPAFIMMGFAIIVGTALQLSTGDATFFNVVGLGPVLGPQISFASGCVAAAYAARVGKFPSGRDIFPALLGLDAPDVLLVGGISGALGYVFWWAFANLPPIGQTGATNPIAASIMVNLFIARLLFGKKGGVLGGLFGKVREGDNRWLPTEVANWLPWQSRPLQLLVLGVGLGLGVSWSTIQAPGLSHGMFGLWFGVAAAGLVFLQFGVKVPVWHHIALAAAQAIVVGGGDIWWGVTFALVAAYLGELFAGLFLIHGDTHIDPPTAALVVTFTLTAVLKEAGAFQLSGAPVIVIAAVVAAAGYGLIFALRHGEGGFGTSAAPATV